MRLYLFPFKEVCCREKIVLCGAGVVGREFVRQVKATDYAQILCMVDSAPTQDTYAGFKIKTKENAKEDLLHCDKVVISVLSKKTSDEIRIELLDMGIEPSKIVHSVVKCNLQDCAADIVGLYEPRKKEANGVLKNLSARGYFVGGIPFYIQNREERKAEYLEMRDDFCCTKLTDNSLDQVRLFFLQENLENRLPEVNGSVAEVGVFQGATAGILRKYCAKYRRDLYLFDTFEGFSEKDFVDVDNGKNKCYADTSLEKVRDRVGAESWIHYMQGYFPESVDDKCKSEKYAFVHIDCDLYQPIKEALAFFWNRMEIGGMLAIHDYSSGYWEGATKAVDEFCSEYHIPKVLIPDWSGTVVLLKH